MNTPLLAISLSFLKGCDEAAVGVPSMEPIGEGLSFLGLGLVLSSIILVVGALWIAALINKAGKRK